MARVHPQQSVSSRNCIFKSSHRKQQTRVDASTAPVPEAGVQASSGCSSGYMVGRHVNMHSQYERHIGRFTACVHSHVRRKATAERSHISHISEAISNVISDAPYIYECVANVRSSNIQSFSVCVLYAAVWQNVLQFSALQRRSAHTHGSLYNNLPSNIPHNVPHNLLCQSHHVLHTAGCLYGPFVRHRSLCVCSVQQNKRTASLQLQALYARSARSSVKRLCICALVVYLPFRYINSERMFSFGFLNFCHFSLLKKKREREREFHPELSVSRARSAAPTRFACDPAPTVLYGRIVEKSGDNFKIHHHQV